MEFQQCRRSLNAAIDFVCDHAGHLVATQVINALGSGFQSHGSVLVHANEWLANLIFSMLGPG